MTRPRSSSRSPTQRREASRCTPPSHVFSGSCLTAVNYAHVGRSHGHAIPAPSAPRAPGPCSSGGAGRTSFLPSDAFVTFLFVELFRINFNREVEALTCSGPLLYALPRAPGRAASTARPATSGQHFHPVCVCLISLLRARPCPANDLLSPRPCLCASASLRFTFQRFPFLFSSRAASVSRTAPSSMQPVSRPVCAPPFVLSQCVKSPLCGHPSKSPNYAMTILAPAPVGLLAWQRSHGGGPELRLLAGTRCGQDCLGGTVPIPCRWSRML